MRCHFDARFAVLFSNKLKEMKQVFTTLLCCIGIAAFSQEAQKRQITPAQIDAVFAQWDTPDRPGIAVGVLNDGEIVYTKGYGQANLEHTIAISPETRFHIGDLAKEFTVYALLLLEQRGQLSLQDDVRKHLPQLASLTRPITIEQLMHHTGGLNNDEVSKALAGWQAGDVFTKEQAYTMIRNQAKATPNSGSVQRPTNSGFMILEDLIAKVGETTYGDFITEEIFKPLKMTSSVFDREGAVIPNKAQGYFAQGDGFIRSAMHPSQNIVSDVYTTVKDMCFWAKELGDPKIGTAEMVKKFDALSVVGEAEVAETNTALYTGGHRYWNLRGAKKLYHVEVAGGYASKLIRYPDYDLAVVIMGNDGAYNGYAGTGASALYIEDFLDPMVTGAAATTKSKKLSKKQLVAFEGDYWDAANHTSRKISVVNDTLRYMRGPGNESALVPLAKNSFKMITNATVVVEFDSATDPKNMSVTVGDDKFHLTAYDSNAPWTNNLQAFTGTYYAEALGASYTVVLENGTLVLSHPRVGMVQLDPRVPNLFAGNRRHFDSLAFEKDTNGTVTGFALATFGVADIWFQKETPLGKNLAKTR